MFKKEWKATIKKASDSDYDATFVVSSPDPDRVGDTIDPDAYTPSLGKRIPALWQHDHDRIFGVWENLRVIKGQLIGDLKAASTRIGDLVKQLLADDIPLGASIGFMPTEYEANDDGGLHFKAIEVLEISVVSVPAHQAAVQIKSLIDKGAVQSSNPPPAMSGQFKTAIENARAALDRANEKVE